ncbi:alpha-glucosidase [Treponema brennaborense]|uniref:Oligo-1,6-glucosidase n=1 Tax=Treponema brennaborense (strain DSM 12168 / CIP 105900 / DD5/3) TaxID=906968 RepID=F4LIN6_TREBD|nr:alpha-glucosidase [Treponema brennaborense]AEE17261.1 Oligo-1,6-glucosidase [Treponema brennaborense DSM 12168]
MNIQIPWWKERVVYQIYPRSFCDSDDDGVGDIPGIISKLDYLAALGVGILWLSPVYRSPNDDNGYDISGYRDIQSEFGTMDDMKRLVSEAEKRGIKIIMDLVINHTSDEHPWFTESRKSVRNPYRQYYIWRPGKTGKHGEKLPPNNWTGFFTGPAWEYDAHTDEYYLHLFSKKQPDLNFHNPDVIAAVKDIMRFWLDLGIGGFRCDVINLIFKTSLADGKKRIALTGCEHYHSQRGCHEILAELRRDVLSEYDCFTVGETVLVTPKQARDLCRTDGNGSPLELDMVFSFEHMECDQIHNKWFKTPFRPKAFMRTLIKWQRELEWNALYFENHDQPRSVSRFGSARYRTESAKLLAVLLFTLRGTPFVYEGQELGMENGDFTSMSDIRDIESHNIWKLTEKLHFPAAVRWKMIRQTGRDNARTPMQWSAAENAGFSPNGRTVPWLKVNANKTTVNVETESADPDSVLNWYKKLINLRKKTPELTAGEFNPLYESGSVFAFERVSEESDAKRRALIVLNFGKKRRRLPAVLAARIGSMHNAKTLCSVSGTDYTPDASQPHVPQLHVPQLHVPQTGESSGRPNRSHRTHAKLPPYEAFIIEEKKGGTL